MYCRKVRPLQTPELKKCRLIKVFELALRFWSMTRCNQNNESMIQLKMTKAFYQEKLQIFFHQKFFSTTMNNVQPLRAFLSLMMEKKREKEK